MKMNNNNNEWKKVCAACAEGTPPERCAYYGDPNGCNAPTLGRHPEGYLAERLQEALDKAVRRIAELERTSCNVAAIREALEKINEMCGVGPNEVSSMAIAHICDAALAAPARNVDTVKSLDDFLSEKYMDDADLEMIKEWREDEVAFCLRYPRAGSLLHSLRWLFLSAKEGGAK